MSDQRHGDDGHDDHRDDDRDKDHEPDHHYWNEGGDGGPLPDAEETLPDRG